MQTHRAAVTDSQMTPLDLGRAKPRPKKIRVVKKKRPPRDVRIQAAKLAVKKQHGIAPKGKGPHPASAYELPVPPGNHPLAKAMARNTLTRAKKVAASGKYRLSDIKEQVGKANAILYGSSEPTLQDKVQARAQAAMLRKNAPHRESDPGVIREVLKIQTPLLEVSMNAEKGTARALLIRSGPGNAADRHYYTPDSLEKAVADKVFEGAQCFFDHPTTVEDKIIPERSTLKLAGWFSDIESTTYTDPVIGDCVGVFADFHPQVDEPRTLSIMRTCTEYAAKYPQKSYIGFSINALGSGEQAEIKGQTWNRVDEISECVSVDLVTKAGAGGKPVAFKESLKMAVRTPARDASKKTPAEKLAEARRMAREAKTELDKGFNETLELDTDALKSGVKKILEGKKADAVKALEAAGLTLTPEQIDSLGNTLGIVEDGPLDSLLDTVLGSTEDEDDDGSVEGEEAGVEAETVEAEDDISAMSEEQAKTELRKARLSTRESRKIVSAAQESLREAKVREASALRDRTATAVLDELKIPASFHKRILFEVSTSGLNNRKAIVEHVQSFDKAFIRPLAESAGNPGRVDNARVSTAPACLADE